MTPERKTPATSGFGRRCGAIFYDLLTVVAVLIFAAIPFVLAAGDTSRSFLTRLIFQLYLLAVVFLYYAGFWVYGGQTLGLRTWKLRLVAADGRPVTWVRAGERFAAAIISFGCLGIGFLWALWDRERLTWYDRFSGTRVIRVPSGDAPQQE